MHLLLKWRTNPFIHATDVPLSKQRISLHTKKFLTPRGNLEYIENVVFLPVNGGTIKNGKERWAHA